MLKSTSQKAANGQLTFRMQEDLIALSPLSCQPEAWGKTKVKDPAHTRVEG